MAAIVVKRTALFVAIVLLWAFLAAIARAAPNDIVAFSGFQPGTIVIKTGERRLYFVLDGTRAMRFPVGVGRRGKTWSGIERIDGKYVQPAWQAPTEIWGNRPGTPPVIPGGSPPNPMGAGALTMRGGEYAIHGTNNPASIGGFVSSGCIRMHNADVVTLYQMVQVGTPVIVQQ
jgi:lipoprotein-anchoring transpeptidase ErfK/SrfK